MQCMPKRFLSRDIQRMKETAQSRRVVCVTSDLVSIYTVVVAREEGEVWLPRVWVLRSDL